MFETRAAHPKPLPQFPYHPPPARPPAAPAHAGWLQHAWRLRRVCKCVRRKVVAARELRRELRVRGVGGARRCAWRLFVARHLHAVGTQRGALPVHRERLPALRGA